MQHATNNKYRWGPFDNLYVPVSWPQPRINVDHVNVESGVSDEPIMHQPGGPLLYSTLHLVSKSHHGPRCRVRTSTHELVPTMTNLVVSEHALPISHTKKTQSSTAIPSKLQSSRCRVYNTTIAQLLCTIVIISSSPLGIISSLLPWSI